MTQTREEDCLILNGEEKWIRCPFLYCLQWKWLINPWLNAVHCKSWYDIALYIQWEALKARGHLLRVLSFAWHFTAGAREFWVTCLVPEKVELYVVSWERWTSHGNLKGVKYQCHILPKRCNMHEGSWGMYEPAANYRIFYSKHCICHFLATVILPKCFR